MRRSVVLGVRIALVLIAAAAAVYLAVIGIRELTVKNSYRKVTVDNYQSFNGDSVAYLEIEGLKLSYPVVQTGNNTDYLHRDFWGNPSEYGCIFCDYRNDPTADPAQRTQNLIFYGHSMYTGSMFAPLNEYLINADREDFQARCAEIRVDVLGEKRVYRVFSAYYADSATCSESVQTDFTDETEWKNWIADRSAESMIPVPEIPETVQQVLTLQTCHYNNQGDRIFVHAYLE